MSAITSLSPSPLACWLIAQYQRHVSPRKGFRCAYRARKGRSSCSRFARRAIERLGLLPGIRLLRRRFAKCHTASKVLEYESPRREKEKRQAGSSSADADCLSGCDGSVPADACDAAGALADVGGSLAGATGDAATGCADGAACDLGCCDISV